jgi:Ca-activated chloride channel family protein
MLYALAGGTLATRAVAGQFASGVRIIEVYATVTSARGEPVKGLTQDQFAVFEDGVEQQIATFAAGNFGLTLAIAVDRSWSMAGEPLALAKAAAATILDALQSQDQSTVIAISGQVETVAPLSADARPAREAVERLDPWSTTALHDAIVVAIERVQGGTGRRALVLLSDAGDRYSRRTVDEVLDAARRSDVLIYPVAIGRHTSTLFPELASLTGGRSFQVRKRDDAEATARTIVTELHDQYLLGYTPRRPASEGVGQWRSVRVEVKAPDVRVRARDGYMND